MTLFCVDGQLRQFPRGTSEYATWTRKTAVRQRIYLHGEFFTVPFHLKNRLHILAADINIVRRDGLQKMGAYTMAVILIYFLWQKEFLFCHNRSD